MEEGVVNVKIVIGRTNPPHAGHIKLMADAIQDAHTAPGSIKCALILLGNGPEGQRTNEDPIDHDTKSAFLRKKLSAVRYKDEKGNEGPFFREGVDFVVMRMYTSEEGGQSGNISEFLQNFGIQFDYPGSIHIVQFTGGKPGKISKTGRQGRSDSEKHETLRFNIQKNIKGMYHNSADVTCGFKQVHADIIAGETPMSATKVREEAVKCFEAAAGGGGAAAAADSGGDCWRVKYPFYNGDGDAETLELSKLMFAAIIKFKDTKFKKSSSETRKRPRPVAEGEPAGRSFVKIQTAKPPGPGGSRRKHTRRRASKLRNKKTLRNIRRRR